jgi:hypothetical protein
MKRLKYSVLLAVIIIGAWLMALPGIAGAASTLYIDITATGSEVTITCNDTIWAIGVVSAGDNVSTAIGYFKLSNTTSEAVNVTIHGNEMVDVATGAAENWTMSATGTPGANTFGMRAGVDDADDDWDTLIKDHDSGGFSTLAFDADDSLAAADDWDFGFNFLPPSSSVGNSAMVMSDDTGAQFAEGGATNGVTLIATIA